MLKGLLLSFFLLLNAMAFGQNLRGIIVSSADSIPLENVHILIIGKNAGTISNSNGSFAVQLDSSAIISLSRLGFENLILTASTAFKSDTFYMSPIVYEMQVVEASEAARIEAYKQKTIYRDPSETKTPKVVEKEAPSVRKPGKSPAASAQNIVEFLYEQFSEKAKSQKEYNALMSWQEKVDYWRAFLRPDDLQDLWGLDAKQQNLFWAHISGLQERNLKTDWEFLEFLMAESYPFSSWR